MAPVSDISAKKRIEDTNGNATKNKRVRNKTSLRVGEKTLSGDSEIIRGGSGVMKRRPSSKPIILESARQVKSRKRKSKQFKKNKASMTPRKSARLMFRNVQSFLSLEEKPAEAHLSPEMPRTVELIANDSAKSRCKKTKVFFLAALGLYPRPDERGLVYQQRSLKQECDKATVLSNIKDNDSGTESMAISPTKTSSEIDSSVSEYTVTSEGEGDNWEDDKSPTGKILRTKDTIIIKEISSDSDSSDYPNSPVEKNESDDSEAEAGPSSAVCNLSNDQTEDDEGWENFGEYVEALLKDEMALELQQKTKKVSADEIKEAVLKLVSIPGTTVHCQIK